MEELSVLDLGCLEGLYCVELGELEHADVRSLSVATHGRFDVILCLGLLYHLDAADVFGLVRTMAEMCGRVMIVTLTSPPIR